MELNERNCRDFFISGFPSAGGSDAGGGSTMYQFLSPRMKAGREANINPFSLLLISDLSLSSHPIYLSIFYLSLSLSPLDTR